MGFIWFLFFIISYGVADSVLVAVELSRLKAFAENTKKTKEIVYDPVLNLPRSVLKEAAAQCDKHGFLCKYESADEKRKKLETTWKAAAGDWKHPYHLPMPKHIITQLVTKKNLTSVELKHWMSLYYCSNHLPMPQFNVMDSIVIIKNKE